MNSVEIHEKQIRTEGYTIIRNFIKSNDVDKFLSLLNNYYDPNIKWPGLPDRDSLDKRLFALPSLDKNFTDLVTDPFIQNILKPLLNDPYYRLIPKEYPNFIINSCSARSSGEFLDLHIDSIFPFLGNIPLGIVSIFAIEDCNVDTGCTFGVPGSHKSGKFTDRSYSKLENFLLKPGDCLLLDSRLWHGARENKSQKSRWTINCHYTQWFVKQDHDLTKMIPADIYKNLSIEQKILLGFCSISSPNPKKRINIKTGLDKI